MDYMEVFNNAWNKGYRVGYYSTFIPYFIITSMIGAIICYKFLKKV